MIAIDLEFLTGRYVATSYNDRKKPEWPPHPARFFSALVAAWAEEEGPDNSAAAALDALASAGDPEILASAATARTVMQVYVPDVGPRLLTRTPDALSDVERARAALDAAEQDGNAGTVNRARKQHEKARERFRRVFEQEIRDDGADEAATIEAAVSLLPARRGKQPRTFPSVNPTVPTVTFVWRDAEPSAEQRAALARLLASVTRLGHSSSMVWCRIRDDQAAVTEARDRWVPSDGGDQVLRVVGAGQHERLQAAFSGHRGVEPRVLPCRFQSYRRTRVRAEAEAARTVFGGDWLVFREIEVPGRPRLGLGLTRAPDIARALRNALMSYADDPPPALLTGHSGDGAPLQEAHAALVSLPDVASRWSSGTVLGVALVFPRTCAAEDRTAILRAIGRWEADRGGAPLPVQLGRAGVLWVERVTDDEPRATLRPGTWCSTTRHWGSVTPVALDQNPGNLAADDPVAAARASDAAQEIVARSCERIGLPRPTTVEILRRSIFDGPPSARQFMPFPRKDGALRRVCVHVEIVFAEPVCGPLLLGAGRYQGLGLLRAIRAEDAT